MRVVLFYLMITCVIFGCDKKEKIKVSNIKNEDGRIIKVKIGIDSNKISSEWKAALLKRKSTSELDSISKIIKHITKEEQDWLKLIESKTKRWNAFRDSLKVPFQNIKLQDTIFILLGYHGGDDAFTFQNKTICLDVNALYNSYGSAKDTVNDNRIDRFFAHEFTHLLHKQWAKKNKLEINTFKDRIFWECITEGFGMYRSMSPKWFPIKDSLSETSKNTFKVLYPIFTERIIEVSTKSNFTSEEENRLHTNLSRGSMKKKWGALPVAVWLALEAKGNDENLIKWVNKGPDALIPLAEKYLINESKTAFDKFLNNN
ncbi:DUF5700 domain-containing putative Zn-dependent protease [Flavivirga rizhaonensis]|uniref:DUF2268 domain-containing protein n=1 Tax=Flavivirga rizhaonensis TaxID=2559571 RepID=A0A4V6R454_9FLAO|nr:DUF5700 domain-containing putative Zn-dependent protease [Flavivirga rizhaonensis]TGV00594.1 hypothetical protein EM932_18850 [Flavivirga rizhaonensis]